MAPIKNFIFDSQYKLLAWSDADNSTNARLTFYTEDSDSSNSSGVLHITGKYWNKGSEKPDKSNFFGTIDKTYITPFVGAYKTICKSSDPAYVPGHEFFVSTDSSGRVQLTVGSTKIENLTFNNPVLSWSSDENSTNGNVVFYMDSTKKQPMFYASYWPKGSTKPENNNVFGTFDSKFLQPWIAYYTTSLLSANSVVTGPGPAIKVIGTTSPSGTFLSCMALH